MKKVQEQEQEQRNQLGKSNRLKCSFLDWSIYPRFCRLPLSTAEQLEAGRSRSTGGPTLAKSPSSSSRLLNVTKDRPLGPKVRLYRYVPRRTCLYVCEYAYVYAYGSRGSPQVGQCLCERECLLICVVGPKTQYASVCQPVGRWTPQRYGCKSCVHSHLRIYGL